MKVVFLASTRGDLDWFRLYYGDVFTDGAAAARVQFQRALANLRDNPHIGHPSDEPGNREFPITRTPFLIAYRVANGRIEILRIRDGRSGRADPLPSVEE